MGEQGFDLSRVAMQMVSSVPLWLLLFFILRGWLKKKADADESVKASIAGLHEKINRIEMSLATEGIVDLKKNMESLMESRTKHETQIQSIFKLIKMPRALKQ